MKSHVYQLTFGDWARVLGPTLLAMAAGAAFIHAAAQTHLFPAGSPAASLDEVIVRQKTENCRERLDPQLIFIGDSSCLMDVSASELLALNPGLRTWNLGTLSTLGLPRFHELLQSFLQHNPKVQTVVLLISPEMVRTSAGRTTKLKSLTHEAERRKRALLAQRRRGVDAWDPSRWLAGLYRLLGLPELRTQVADRLLHSPLRGNWGEFYGFFADVTRYMAAHGGGALDPSTRAESPMAPPLQSSDLPAILREQCQAFRGGLPASLTLAVGVTPIPQTEAPPGYRERYQAVLLHLQQALQAQVALTNLPSTLGDACFASSTHLSPLGTRPFTHELYSSLVAAGLVPQQPSNASPR